MIQNPMLTNLLIQFTNVAFACVLESAPSVVGPWSDAESRFAACPQTQVFNVPVLQSMGDRKGIAPGDWCTNNCGTNVPFGSFGQFFRLRVLDNGIVPTPAPSATIESNAVILNAGLVFTCNDDSVGYRWYRDFQVITNRTDGHAEVVDFPPLGTHFYSVQAVDGTNVSWLSPAMEIEAP